MGIYGFLSAAYQETAAKSGNIDAQITLIEKKNSIQTQSNCNYLFQLTTVLRL